MFLLLRNPLSVKCLSPRDKTFSWKIKNLQIHKIKTDYEAPSCGQSRSPSNQTAESSSLCSVLRASSPSSRESSVTRSRSPPRTPRSSRTQNPRSPRIASPSPVRDQLPLGSPRQSRIDTPTRRNRLLSRRGRRVQYPCRNVGCSETFRFCNQRNSHENSSCNHRPQHQV